MKPNTELILALRAERNILWSRNPLRKLRLIIKGALNRLSVSEKVHLDKYPYPHYAYGIYAACLQAHMLGIPRIKAVEFGVAGGNGLLAMENAALEIGDRIGVVVDVIGVDQGNAGLPPTQDHRDMVYWFRPGAYAMDEAKLRQRIKRAQLVIGNIEETLPILLSKLDAPIGFCSLDMDYYSSTISALRIFAGPTKNWLPRTLIYADDIFGFDDMNIMGECVGEEAAFSEFNRHDSRIQICPIRGLRHKRPRPAMWNEKMYAFHDFSHPEYNKSVNPLSTKELSELLALNT